MIQNIATRWRAKNKDNDTRSPEGVAGALKDCSRASDAAVLTVIGMKHRKKDRKKARVSPKTLLTSCVHARAPQSTNWFFFFSIKSCRAYFPVSPAFPVSTTRYFLRQYLDAIRSVSGFRDRYL